MGTDDDVARAGRQPLERTGVGRAGLEPGDGLDSYRRSVESRGEGLEVLLCEDRRRREDGRLLAVQRRYVRRPHGDLGLAVARVAADQPVHRLARREVVLHGLDGGELVWSLLVGERGVEGVASVAIYVVREARHQFAPCLRLEKRGRQVGDGLLRVRLVLVPALPVQPVQADLLSLHAYVA